MLREVKVGLLTLVALVVFAAGVFLIGDRQQLFSRKGEYSIRFASTGGLSRGSSVQLNGVTVGQVTDVVLPLSVDEASITVMISVDRRYDLHIREDSLARIKTLGLLGDKYIDINSGSPEAPQVPVGGEIPAAPATDVDRLLASGEDLVENVLAMTVSLRTILTRMESGQGLLGELTASEEDGGGQIKQSLRSTLESIDNLLKKLDQGQGSLGILLNDPTLAHRAESAVAKLEETVAAFETGEGIMPALLHDAEMKEQFTALLSSLEGTTTEVGGLVAEIRNGEGLLNKLLHDKTYADKVSGDLERMMENLSLVTEKLNSGDGTVAQLINDPEIYEALNDILVGVDESKFLRWLIRNRQKSGIEERYDEEVEAMEAEGLEVPPLEPVDAGEGG